VRSCSLSKLSDGERKYLLNCAKDEGLFFALGSHVPMEVAASPQDRWVAKTNPQALAAEMQANLTLALPNV
jgi:hypothetical protein